MFLIKIKIYIQLVLQDSKILINQFLTKSTKWSNMLKQFVGKSRQIVWVCLTILWSVRLKS